MSEPLELRPTATRPEVEARRAERRRKAAELADRVIASVASDGVDAMQELDHLRGEYEDRRLALVAALHLPPETTWEEALARVVPVPAEVAAEPTAKGCRGCKGAGRFTCWFSVGRPDIARWILAWTFDGTTPKPGAPECPGRIER